MHGVVSEIEAGGGKALAAMADVTDEAAVERMALQPSSVSAASTCW